MKFVLMAAYISAKLLSWTTEHTVYFLTELQNAWLSVNTSLKRWCVSYLYDKITASVQIFSFCKSHNIQCF